MNKLTKLKTEARAAAAWRGHALTRFHQDGHRYYANCALCEMQVQVKPRPAPNEIDVGGEAVALNCKGSK
jgi:hypothetical protein